MRFGERERGREKMRLGKDTELGKKKSGVRRERERNKEGKHEVRGKRKGGREEKKRGSGKDNYGKEKKKFWEREVERYVYEARGRDTLKDL